MVEQTMFRFLSDFVLFGLDNSYNILHVDRYFFAGQVENSFARLTFGDNINNNYYIKLLFKRNEIRTVEITDTELIKSPNEFVKSIEVDSAYLLGDLLVFTNNGKHVLTINKDLNSVKYNE